jgi:hypothetical protein
MADYDEWLWRYCDKQALDPGRTPLMVKDAWEEGRKHLTEENKRLIDSMGVIDTENQALLAKLNALTLKHDEIQTAYDELLKLKPTMSAPVTMSVHSPENYKSLGALLWSIYLEYLIRGLGFGCGIALILALFQLAFHRGVC